MLAESPLLYPHIPCCGLRSVPALLAYEVGEFVVNYAHARRNPGSAVSRRHHENNLSRQNLVPVTDSRPSVSSVLHHSHLVHNDVRAVESPAA